MLIEPPPPPIDVKLRNASQNQLVFTLSPGVEPCQAVHYIVNSTNCGSCPTITNSTFFTCENLELTSNIKICSLNVITVVCDDLVGETGQNIQITMKGNLS